MKLKDIFTKDVYKEKKGRFHFTPKLHCFSIYPPNIVFTKLYCSQNPTNSITVVIFD